MTRAETHFDRAVIYGEEVCPQRNISQASLQKEAFNRTHKKMLTYHDLYAILMKQRKKSFFFALNSGNGFEAAQARN